MSLACPFCYAVIKEENVNDFTEKPNLLISTGVVCEHHLVLELYVEYSFFSYSTVFFSVFVRLNIGISHILPYFFLYLYSRI